MTVIKTLKKSREMLEERYIKGELFMNNDEEYAREVGVPNWQVCGMGALSMTTLGRASYFDEDSLPEGEFAEAMDAIAETWMAMPQDHWIKEKLRSSLQPERVLTIQDPDEPFGRRTQAGEVVVAVNDHLGKEAILALFDAAICYTKREAGLSPAPPSDDAAPTDELQPPSGESVSS